MDVEAFQRGIQGLPPAPGDLTNPDYNIDISWIESNRRTKEEHEAKYPQSTDFTIPTHSDDSKSNLSSALDLGKNSDPIEAVAKLSMTMENKLADFG